KEDFSPGRDAMIGPRWHDLSRTEFRFRECVTTAARIERPVAGAMLQPSSEPKRRESTGKRAADGCHDQARAGAPCELCLRQAASAAAPFSGARNGPVLRQPACAND